MTDRSANHEMIKTVIALHRERGGEAPENLIEQILEAEETHLDDPVTAAKVVERIVEKHLIEEQ
jgi:hypothetical protein